MQFATRPGLDMLLRNTLHLSGLVDIPLHTLRGRYETPHSHYLPLQGMSVHYSDEGQGPVLILLHGIMSSLHTWDGWVEALRPHYRIIRIDLPGFGLTGQHPQRRYHPLDYGQFLDAFRAALSIERFYLAGNSMGGIIAWLYARHFPEHVEKLVLLNPAGYQQPVQGMLRLVANPAVMRAAQHCLPRFLMSMGLREVYGDPERMRPGTDRRYHELMLRPGNREAMADVARAIIALNQQGLLEQDIRHVKTPTLLIWGELDRWIPPALVSRWQTDMPHIQVKVYTGVGHVPMEEIPERSAADAHRFLKARTRTKKRSGGNTGTTLSHTP